MELTFALTVIWLLLPSHASTSYLSTRFVLEPYDLLFDTAVEAYYNEDWLSVILNMEKALRNRATVRKVKADCRLGCANQSAFEDHSTTTGFGIPIPGAGSVEDLAFFWKILRRADCVNSCQAEKLGQATLHLVGQAVELEFTRRTPYNYLQVAYFKINQLDKAVAAASTFFRANKDHMEMRQNLDYYGTMSGVRQEDFKDLEARPHMANFLMGKSYYSDNYFSLAAKHFEVAVNDYLAANEECRALCEGSYNYDGYNYMEYDADLYQTMTDHYIQVLNCKQRCSVELAVDAAGSDQPLEDFLPSHFNYLQFSYYNSENYELAIECAKTYLLFHPDDEVMKQNRDYYSAVLGSDKLIAARQIVKQFVQRSLLEKELMYFGYEAFGRTFIDPDTWTPEDIMPRKLKDKQKSDRETAARITEEIGNLMKEIETLVEEKKKDSTDLANVVVATQEGGSPIYDNIKVSMTSAQLNGSQRVLLDGVIADDECAELHRLSNAAALKGDGYRGQPSPHSAGEMFQGVTILKALKLAQEGKVSLKAVRLFSDVGEKVRRLLESYFGLASPLYFSYSHLVCRSAIEGKQETRNDHLSHSVHVDNCLLVSELNECFKEPPAYTHRDFSAILYLNDDFEGGDFIFTELDAKSVTAVVRPQCGRVVGFGAGKENPHGVRAVTKGQRCAVALWFTLDPAHEDKERLQAQHMFETFASALMPGFDSKGPMLTQLAGETEQAKANHQQGAPDGEEQVETYPGQTEKTVEVKKDGIPPVDVDGKDTLKTKVEQLEQKNASKMDHKSTGSHNGKEEL
ncbi:prolyl 3-hydroxylase 1 isoform X2 [Syngnathus typhle]|uniref:prolyl 3-hydroxylase 1 isoform X2 n=1 Tax=Syngnathus typhle TaxID=161592 RepID=UPI002A6AB50B|nr:prolyl 3-hydroxylase 1 isoform X2 [Syngnathus typhle]